jgi:hypothetical protein
MNKKRYERFIQSLREHVEAGYIKVRVVLDPGEGGPAAENLWAQPIGKNYARLCNTPFFCPQLGLHDIVKIKPPAEEGDILREFECLVSRGSYTVLVRYLEGPDDNQTLIHYRALAAYCREHKFEERVFGIEPIYSGMAGVSVPIGFALEEAKEVLNNAPYLLEHSLSGATAADYEINFERFFDDEFEDESDDGDVVSN